MRLLCLPLLLWAQLVWPATASQKIEGLSVQVAPLWQTLKPVCIMGVDVDLQPGLQARLDFLDEQLMSSNLIANLVKLAGRDTSTAWSSPVWALQDQLEKAALQTDEREALREYYFKLQTQTPGKHRSKLVGDVQYMSEQLNLTLREQIWKSCHALGIAQVPLLQMEASVEQRWLKQAQKVKQQIHDELAAFYFYSFRSVENTELEVIARLSTELHLWVDGAKVNIEKYFGNIRARLLEFPLPSVNHSTDEPFPVIRPWLQAPSQELIRP